MGVLTVNRLPVPTWNSLRVNNATVELPESFAPTEPQIAVPERIEFEIKDFKNANEEIELLVEKLPNEAVVAGKQPIIISSILVPLSGRILRILSTE